MYIRRCKCFHFRPRRLCHAAVEVTARDNRMTKALSPAKAKGFVHDGILQQDRIEAVVQHHEHQKVQQGIKKSVEAQGAAIGDEAAEPEDGASRGHGQGGHQEHQGRPARTNRQILNGVGGEATRDCIHHQDGQGRQGQRVNKDPGR